MREVCCAVCGRKLKSKLSIERGMGPGCAKKKKLEIPECSENQEQKQNPEVA